MIITDKMVDGYMDAKSDDWRAGTIQSIARIRAFVREDLEHAAAVLAPAIAAAEREECARIAERRTSEGVASAALALAGSDYMRGMTDTSDAIARAIRARGASCA